MNTITKNKLLTFDEIAFHEAGHLVTFDSNHWGWNNTRINHIKYFTGYDDGTHSSRERRLKYPEFPNDNTIIIQNDRGAKFGRKRDIHSFAYMHPAPAPIPRRQYLFLAEEAIYRFAGFAAQFKHRGINKDEWVTGYFNRRKFDKRETEHNNLFLDFDEVKHAVLVFNNGMKKEWGNVDKVEPKKFYKKMWNQTKQFISNPSVWKSIEAVAQHIISKKRKGVNGIEHAVIKISDVAAITNKFQPKIDAFIEKDEFWACC